MPPAGPSPTAASTRDPGPSIVVGAPPKGAARRPVGVPSLEGTALHQRYCRPPPVGGLVKVGRFMVARVTEKSPMARNKRQAQTKYADLMSLRVARRFARDNAEPPNGRGGSVRRR